MLTKAQNNQTKIKDIMFDFFGYKSNANLIFFSYIYFKKQIIKLVLQIVVNKYAILQL